MAQLAIADSAFAGFGLIGRKPLSVLAWGAAQILFFVVILIAVGGAFLGPFIALIQQGANPDPSKIMGMMGSLVGAYFLFLVGALVMGAVVSCAVMRAVLEPQNSSFAYLRLGAQELWLVLVIFVQALCFFAVLFAMGLVLGVLAAATHNNPIVSVLGVILICVATLYLALRFSLAGPMTFSERGFRLFHSWGVTRGHVGALLLVGLILVAVAIGISIVQFIITLIVNLVTMGLTANAMGGGSLQNLQSFSQHPMTLLAQMAPVIIVQLILYIISTAIFIAVFTAPWAEAYRQLKPGPEVAATFT